MGARLVLASVLLLVGASPVAAESDGSLAIVPGGTGSGQITSDPPGIDCTITRGNGSGTCWAFFPAGSSVRLDAHSAADTHLQGWRGLPGCSEPARVTIFADTTIYCQPGLQLTF
jgi:hypothetical protein